MTAAEIDALPAGRELDELVAKRVMEIPPEYWTAHMFPASYSTDIGAAWLVVERLAEQYGVECCVAGGRWQVALKIQGPAPEVVVLADTAPLAVCRAALKAVA